jgi:HK97 family phage major capsid protein
MTQTREQLEQTARQWRQSGALERGGTMTITLETLAKSVHDLAEAVDRYKQGSVGAETVERIAREVVQNGRASGGRRSFTPEDVDGLAPQRRHELQSLQGRARLAMIQVTPADEVSDAIGLNPERVRDFQQAADSLVVMSMYLTGQRRTPIDPRDLAFYEDEFLPALQAMDSGTTAEGKEFVPTDLSASLIERVNASLLVAQLFPYVDMPTSPYEIPAFAITRTRGGLHAEQTADTGQTKIKKITPASRKVTLTAKKFAVEVILSKELEEDSLIPMLPFLEQELVDYISADIEDSTINGDTAGTHQDSDVTTADDPRKQWDGLRKSLLLGAKVDAANAALTSAMLRKNRQNMGRYGIRSDQLAHLISIWNYIDLLGDANVVTMDKYGPRATVLTGELAKVDGVPVIASEYVRPDLNASGVYDGTTTNRSIALTVNTRGFLYGSRREMSVQVLNELYAESDQDAIIVTNRRAFAPRFPVATEKIVAAHYNVKTA